MQSSDGAAGAFLLPGKRTGSFLLCSYILMGVAALTFGVVFGSVYVGLTVLVFGYILIACTQKSFDARTAASAVTFSFIVGVVVAMLMYFGYIADYGEPFGFRAPTIRYMSRWQNMLMMRAIRLYSICLTVRISTLGSTMPKAG